jgi:parvulin-like peptidyl-prolyl isomerase
MAEVVAQLKEQVASQNRELEYARLKIQVLEERLRLVRIQKYGPSSEKLSNLQLELLEQEPGVSQEEVAVESERKAPPATEQKEAQASRTSDAARESSPCGTGDCLHTGAVRMRQLRR